MSFDHFPFFTQQENFMRIAINKTSTLRKRYKLPPQLVSPVEAPTTNNVSIIYRRRKMYDECIDTILSIKNPGIIQH